MIRDRDPLEVYNNYYVPMVVEQSARGERGYDIWSRLLKERLRAPIFEEKTVDFILELAKVSEKSVTPEELLKAAREAEAAEGEEEDKAEQPAAN